jgi:hypothetical protein
MAQIDSSVKVCVSKLKEKFSVADDVALAQCQSLVHQLQFLYRLRQEAEALEEALL